VSENHWNRPKASRYPLAMPDRWPCASACRFEAVGWLVDATAARYSQTAASTYEEACSRDDDLRHEQREEGR